MRRCLDCGTLTTSTRCPDHQRARERTRRPAGWDRYPDEYETNKQIVLERDGHLCQLRLPGCTVVATTADHITPRSRGGTHDTSNLRAACATCNTRRGIDR